jgi:hypothetical protein
MEAAWEIPLPGVKLLTPTAIHAHCLLLYFQAVRTGRLYVRLHPAAFFNCSFDRLLCALRLAACPLPQQVEREDRLKRTTKRNLQWEMRRSTVSACA